MLGWRRVTTGWVDDPVQRQGGRRWIERRGSSWLPPPERLRTAGGGGGEVSEDNMKHSLGFRVVTIPGRKSPPHNLDIPHVSVASNTNK